MANLLIIDDDQDLCSMLSELLVAGGFEVQFVHHGVDGLQQILVGSYQLIVLDVMLPGINGIEVLRRIRKHSQVPVLMLTAKGDDMDRIVGLELGADDYLAKPFNPRELVARIQAILRRSSDQPTIKTEDSGHISVEDLQIDLGERTVSISNDPIPVTNIEFEILWLLAKQAGSVVDRNTISEEVFDRSLQVFDRHVDVHISTLRRKIGKRPNGTQRIKTVRGAGYLLAKPSKAVK